MYDTTPLRTAALGLALLAGGLTACTSSSGNPASTDPKPTPSAGDAAVTSPLVLRIGTDDGPDAPAGAQITHFADEVADLSEGTVAVKPVWHAAGEGVPHWDQAIARMAMRADLDLAMVPARAWDALGVSSMTALNAPFLITSDELTAEVVSGDLADDLMSGLPGAGVVGVGLFPEALRHPFSFGSPLRSVEDYDGGLIRTPHSVTTRDVFAALGARVTEAEPDPSTQRGAESSYQLSPAGTATGNVVFYPKVNSLVVNADVRDDLSDRQRGVLGEAAQRTLDWALRTQPDDDKAAREFCAEAGHIVAASPNDVTSLVQATRPVITALRRDPVTDELIDRITDLASTTKTSEPVTSCNDAATSSRVAQLNGVYTTTATAKAFRAAGVTTEDLINENAGHFTITLHDGTWTAEQVYGTGPKKGQTWHGTGGYTIKHGRLTWYWSHEPGSWSRADVETAPDDSLNFTHIADGEGPEFLLLSRVYFHHWQRTGDVH